MAQVTFTKEDREQAKASHKALVALAVHGSHLKGFPYRGYARTLELPPALAIKAVAFFEALAVEAAEKSPT
jgi:hypothetical protein